VAAAIEIGRATPERFSVAADNDLARFADAIKHNEHMRRTGATVMSSR